MASDTMGGIGSDRQPPTQPKSEIRKIFDAIKNDIKVTYDKGLSDFLNAKEFTVRRKHVLMFMMIFFVIMNAFLYFREGESAYTYAIIRIRIREIACNIQDFISGPPLLIPSSYFDKNDFQCKLNITESDRSRHGASIDFIESTLLFMANQVSVVLFDLCFVLVMSLWVTLSLFVVTVVTILVFPFMLTRV
jgi:hypothetical protein